MHEPTISFSLHDDKEKGNQKNSDHHLRCTQTKGYNPINQIVGYILSEDPTYITTYNNARSLIRRIDRDELLQILVKSYLENNSARIILEAGTLFFCKKKVRMAKKGAIRFFCQKRYGSKTDYTGREFLLCHRNF